MASAEHDPRQPGFERYGPILLRQGGFLIQIAIFLGLVYALAVIALQPIVLPSLGSLGVIWRNLAEDSDFAGTWPAGLLHAGLTALFATFASWPVAFAIQLWQGWRRRIAIFVILAVFFLDPAIRAIGWVDLIAWGGGEFLLIGPFAIGLAGIFGWIPVAILIQGLYLHRLDRREVALARQCGAGAWPLAWRLILPQAWPGAACAILVILIGALGQILESRMLGLRHAPQLGEWLQRRLAFASDWPSAASFILIAALIAGSVLAVLAGSLQWRFRSARAKP